MTFLYKPRLIFRPNMYDVVFTKLINILVCKSGEALGYEGTPKFFNTFNAKFLTSYFFYLTPPI